MLETSLRAAARQPHCHEMAQVLALLLARTPHVYERARQSTLVHWDPGGTDHGGWTQVALVWLAQHCGPAGVAFRELNVLPNNTMRDMRATVL